MTGRTRIGAAWLVAAAVSVAGCGGDDDGDVGNGAGERAGPGVAAPRYPYPKDAVSNFVKACAANEGQREVCQCTVDRLQRTLPYRDFVAFDRAVRQGGNASARTRRIFDAAAATCRDES